MADPIDLSALLGTGIDTDAIRKLMEQFQPSEEDRKKAQRDSLMSFGFSLLANPRKGQEFQSLGRAGANAMDTHRGTMQDASRERAQQLVGASSAFDLANKAASYQDTAALRQQQLEFARRFQGGRGVPPPPQGPLPIGPIGMKPPMPGPPAQLAGEEMGPPEEVPPGNAPIMPPMPLPPPTPPPAMPMGPGPQMPVPQMPVPSAGAAPSQLSQPTQNGLPPRRERIERYITQGDYWSSVGREEKAKTFYEQADKLAKIKDQKTLTLADGKTRVTVNVYEDGSTEVLPGFAPDREKAASVNTGRAISARDPYTLQPVEGGADIPVTMTESEAENLKLAKQREAREAAAAARAAATEGAPKYFVTEGGIVAVDPKSRVGSPVVDTAGAPLGVKSEKALTEGQGKATAYGMRMQSAHDGINGLEEKGLNLASPKNLLAHNRVSNYAASPSAQTLYTLKLNWMTANLRKESGATISPSEFEAEDKKYFPQPGDSDLNKREKKKARELAVRSVMVEAGPGAKNISAERAPTQDEIDAELRRRRGQ